MARAIAVTAMVASLAAPAAMARERAAARKPAQCLPLATETGMLAAVDDNGDLLLDDGRLLRQAGVLLATERTAGITPRDHLKRLVGSGLRFALLAPEADRWGRHLVQVLMHEAERQQMASLSALPTIDSAREDAYTLAQWLVELGQARVAPDAFVVALPRPCLTALLAGEERARTRGVGLWQDPAEAVLAAGDADAILAKAGDFAVVEGIIVSVRERERVTYLNFGSQWTRDFTVTILKKHRAKLAAAGLKLASLDGRRVRVRGLVEANRGPLIDVLTAEQIEVIGAE